MESIKGVFSDPGLTFFLYLLAKRTKELEQSIDQSMVDRFRSYDRSQNKTFFLWLQHDSTYRKVPFVGRLNFELQRRKVKQI